MSTPFAAPAPAAPITSTARVASIDLIRGAVMILMAIDHVRVYSGLPAGGPTAGIFFTRWVTHFVAPAFIFLAGTSAYFYGRKHTDLSRFLLVRGIWLVLLELTVIRVAWTFNFDFAHYMLAGVIWVIGWCMILMAALVHLPVIANAVIGCLIVAGHNLLDFASGIGDSMSSGATNALWSVVYGGGVVELGKGGPPLFILYVLVPWIGVMMAGYAFGAVMQLPVEQRRSVTRRMGAVAIAAFLL